MGWGRKWPRPLCGVLFGFVVAGCSTPPPPTASAPPAPSERRAGEIAFAPDALSTLLSEEDCDGDKRITVDDQKAGKSCGADGTFVIVSPEGERVGVRGIVALSHLVGELELARRDGRTSIDLAHVFEPPAARITRSIRERYWDALTRRIDAEHLDAVLADDKVQSGTRTLFVPETDPTALDYFRGVAQSASKPLLVVPVPEQPSTTWLDALEGRHGLLSLALEQDSGKTRGRPYVVPGGRFNELYGWDSYFHVRGLLVDGRTDLARAIVDNLVYEIVHYGKILNANRTYYLTRSQPPFLPAMLRETWQALTKDGATASGTQWLEAGLAAAMREYARVWLAPSHRTSLCSAGAQSIDAEEDPWATVCLSRYYGSGKGQPPEVEPDHFAWIYERFARRRGVPLAEYVTRYRNGSLSEPELDTFFMHDRCMRESGHDTTYRWYDAARGYGRCAAFATVDLAALLYRFEGDVAHLLSNVPADSTAIAEAVRAAGLPAEATSPAWWCGRQGTRAELMHRYLWDADKHLYFDYDVENGRRGDYVSATTLYPLWASAASCAAPLLSPKEAGALKAAALAKLEMAGGVAATSRASQAPFASLKPRQWEFPNGWAPHQVLAWDGLRAFGFRADEERLVYKWLAMITENAAQYAGTVPEKFDVVDRTHQVYAEYGNVGTSFSYITDEGFGWMNASFQVGFQRLSDDERAELLGLEAP